MRTETDHLPVSKRRELERVTRILFEEFEAALKSATQPWKKAGRILKLVLYGSYARGDWVDDPAGGYASDYDILIVVNDERLTDLVDYWSAADDRLMRELTIAKSLSAPVNFIVHSLMDVNRQLERGRPFFIDIAQQGITLYEADGYPFVSPRELPRAEEMIEAAAYFNRWFPSADAFLASAQFLFERGDRNEAAFNLHQATERLYHCVLLVSTLYSPKSHKLNFLRSLAEDVDPRLIEVWPRSTKFERRCFELLRLAYVNARYSPQYTITNEELEWLGEHVSALQMLVKTVCEERLA
ncbi:HEPN domain-containing protein [Sphingomonas agri]|uniref:HEPN domain-containing protein n=1 Tax=Sphingomonas agri TaxID=1813878 RepID=UPI00311DFE82